MQAFAELLAVIIRAAIVVVINQSLTLPDSCAAIYAEYLACVVYESAGESEKWWKRADGLQDDINFGLKSIWLIELHFARERRGAPMLHYINARY